MNQQLIYLNFTSKNVCITNIKQWLIANEMLNINGDTTDTLSTTLFSIEPTIGRWVIFGPGEMHGN